MYKSTIIPSNNINDQENKEFNEKMHKNLSYI